MLDPGNVERAERLEQLLAVEDGEPAVALALSLADLRSAAGDPQGVERALAVASRKRPGDPRISPRLRALAEGRITESRGDRGSSVDLRHVATLFATGLGDPARAAEVLAMARTRAPQDGGVLREIVRTLLGAGATEGALAELGSLPPEIDAATRAELLQLRSGALASLWRWTEAVADLEAAAALGDASAAVAMPALLTRALEAAAGTRAIATPSASSPTGSRRTPACGPITPRCARSLARWLEQEPSDLEALWARVSADEAMGDREAAARGYAQLAATEGARRVEAAMPSSRTRRRLWAAPATPAGRSRRPPSPEPEGSPRAPACVSSTRRAGPIASPRACWSPTPSAPRTRLRASRRCATPVASGCGSSTSSATAIGPLSDARALRPNDHEITLLLADAYAGARLFEEGCQVLTEAMDRQGNRRTREVSVLQHRMAVIAGAIGDQRSRLAWLNASLETFPQAGEVAAELATAAMEADDLELALKGLRARW